MENSIADQIALDDALVAPANRLKIEIFARKNYGHLTFMFHNRSVRFKMNNKKHILNLDQFKDILQICPKVGNKKFEEPPLEKEILAFLASLGHSGEIKKITDVNVNKLANPGDHLLLSSTNVSVDFITRLENKNTERKGNELVLSRFTMLVVTWYDTIPPKTKGSKKKADTDTTTKQKPPTVPKEKKEKKLGKGKQKAKELETISEARVVRCREGTSVSPGVPDAPDYDSDDVISWKSSEDDQANDKNDDDENAQDDANDDKNDVVKTFKMMLMKHDCFRDMVMISFIQDKLMMMKLAHEEEEL
ncbi:hypothetical protein Tco_0318323 [Tanacetum coccineum]